MPVTYRRTIAAVVRARGWDVGAFFVSVTGSERMANVGPFPFQLTVVLY